MKLIVEMEMPKHMCCDCEISIDGFACKKARIDGGRCPIVGVLPDEHGDLIDRDELFETIKSRVTLIDSCPEGKPSMKELFERDVLCTCLHDVVCAKAVIAEERKDDEQIH